MQTAAQSIRTWLRRWPVVAIGAPLLYAIGVSAMYGDQYIIAVVAYFIAIAWFVARVLVWEEAKQHPQRGIVAIIVLAVGVGCLALSLLWVRHTHSGIISARTLQPTKKEASKEIVENARATDKAVARKIPAKTKGRGSHIEHLSMFALEGVQLKQQYQFRVCATGTSPEILGKFVADINDWHHRVELYLETMGISYLARFRNQATPARSYPCAFDLNYHNAYGVWNSLSSDLERLNEFIKELTNKESSGG